MSAAAPRFSDRLRVWWAHPAWSLARGGPTDTKLAAEFEAARSVQQRRTVDPGRAAYLLFRAALLLGATLVFLLRADAIGQVLGAVACVSWLALGLFELSAVSERRRFAAVIEGLWFVLAIPLGRLLLG